MLEMGLLFLFLFSIFTVGKYVVIFLQHLLSNPPKKMVMQRNEMVELTLGLAYFFTYIIH
tara:strand:+ start:474 stop:653 length:180 start_codon:yes stop_codon:yes gene_type:complete